MGVAIGAIGLILSFISVLAIIIMSIFYFVYKAKGKDNSLFKKILFISIGALVISLITFMTGINKIDTSSDSYKLNEKDHIINKKTEQNASISASQLKNVKVGDSYKDVERILGNPKEVDGYRWSYMGDEKSAKDSYAVITFDFENNVEAIEQKDIISKDTTIADADGIDNFDNPKKSTGMYKEENNNDQIDTEENDKDLVQYDTEDVINSFVDENFKSGTELTKLELNDHMGTKKKHDYIALVHMKMDSVYSAKSGFDWIDKYSNYLAAELANHDNRISELVIFWTMPQFADKNYNVAKYNLKRNGKKFYFENKWKDNRLLDY